MEYLLIANSYKDLSKKADVIVLGSPKKIFLMKNWLWRIMEIAI